MTKTIRVYPTADTPHGLGRHVEHDDASRGFAFPEPELATTRSVVWANNHPVLNQMKTQSCEGNAAAQFLNCQIYSHVLQSRFGDTKTWLTESDALQIYSIATHDDGIASEFYPPNDDGSTTLGCAKALEDMGWIDKYLHCFTWHQFLAAIQTQPVMLGTAWTYDMFQTTPHYFVVPGSLDDSNIAGGHEYLCRGIDFTSQVVICRNSWGQNWGHHGEWLFHFRDLQALLERQGDVLVPHVVTTP